MGTQENPGVALSLKDEDKIGHGLGLLGDKLLRTLAQAPLGLQPRSHRYGVHQIQLRVRVAGSAQPGLPARQGSSDGHGPGLQALRAAHAISPPTTGS